MAFVMSSAILARHMERRPALLATFTAILASSPVYQTALRETTELLIAGAEVGVPSLARSELQCASAGFLQQRVATAMDGSLFHDADVDSIRAHLEDAESAALSEPLPTTLPRTSAHLNYEAFGYVRACVCVCVRASEPI